MYGEIYIILFSCLMDISNMSNLLLKLFLYIFIDSIIFHYKFADIPDLNVLLVLSVVPPIIKIHSL